MTTLSKEQMQELKEFLTEQQRDLISSSHQSKDKEISSLHREILNKLNSHDSLFEAINDFVKRATPVIKMAENLTGTAKIILAICASIGILAGGIIGAKEIISNLTKTQ